MAFSNFKGNLGGHISLSVLIPSACLLLFCLFSESSANAIVVDKWRSPCGATPTSSGETQTELLGQMKDNAVSVQTAAATLKQLLNSAENPRVDDSTVNDLQNFNSHITNFPHDVVQMVDSQTNITELLFGDYKNMSTMYIFLDQAIDNSEVCDTRSDKSTIQNQMNTILDRLLSTLCSLDKYLTATDQSMPADQIPSKAEVLANSSPAMNIAHLCSGGTDVSYRNQADYLVAQDTESAMGYLHSRYVTLHTAQSNSS